MDVFSPTFDVGNGRYAGAFVGYERTKAKTCIVIQLFKKDAKGSFEVARTTIQAERRVDEQFEEVLHELDKGRPSNEAELMDAAKRCGWKVLG